MANKMQTFFVALFVLAAGIELASAQGQGQQGGGQPGSFPNMKYLHMHAWFMWTSMGFLFPLGAILIRYSRSQRNPASPTSHVRNETLFYAHIVVQVLAVLFATAGISIMIQVFGSQFQITHTRLGLALLILAMMQPFIGLFRPHKGGPARPFWFTVHWLFGTAVMVLGIINVYIGMQIYGFFTGENLHKWYVLFGLQVSLMGLAYFMQDKLHYILKQGRNSHSHPAVDNKPQTGYSSSEPMARPGAPMHHSPDRFTTSV